jgi:hypothetical protein
LIAARIADYRRLSGGFEFKRRGRREIAEKRGKRLEECVRDAVGRFKFVHGGFVGCGFSKSKRS